jgi:hypothetical protein
MESRHLRAPALSLLLGLLLLAPAAASAQQADDADLLRRRVVQLEDRVAALEEQITQLQAAPGAPGAQTLPLADPGTTAAALRLTGTEGWRALENWRRLRQGLGQIEVGYLLGQPGRVVVGERSTLWLYPDAWGGRVRFDTESGRVEAWAEPSR